MTDFRLYRCVPLRAWISEAQCETNAERCARGMKAPLGTPQRMDAFDYVRACSGCPGVLAVGEAHGYKPRLMEVRRLPDAPLASGPRVSMRSVRKAQWVTADWLARRAGATREEVIERLRDRVTPSLRRGVLWYPRVRAERELSA